MNDTKLKPVTVGQGKRAIVMLDERAAKELSLLVEQGLSTETVTEQNYAHANKLVGQLARAARDLESDRKRLKAPVLELGRAIDSASREIQSKVDSAKRDLSHKVSTFVRELEEKRREAEAKQREALLKAEADAKAAESLSQDVKTVEDRVAVEQLQEEAAVVDLAPLPEVPKSNVSVRRTATVDVFDLAALPTTFNGAPLVEPKKSTIKKLLEMGIEIPGARLLYREDVVSRAK